MKYRINNDEFSGAIFDLDGTLLNSLDVWREIDIRFFAKRNIPIPDEFFRAISSMNFQSAAEYVKSAFSLKESVNDIITEWFDDAYSFYSSKIELKDGAYEYLKALSEKGVKIALATASDKRLYEAALEHHDIRKFFDVFATTIETKRGKGYPDVYELACRRLGIDKDDCVVFEDIVEGIIGARNGGFKVCCVYDSHSQGYWETRTPPADYYIKSFMEII